MAGQIAVSIVSRIGSVRRSVEANVAAAIEKAAFDIEATAKQLAPVDTSNLRNSIEAEPEPGSDIGWRVTAHAEYAVYQEFGTRHQPGTPFLIPAADAVTPSLQAALRQILGNRAEVDFEDEIL